MKVDKKEFSDKVKQLLRERGMTQAVFAAEIEVTEAAVSNYLTMKALPPSDILARMAWALCVSADYLLGIDREKKTIQLPYRITPNSVIYWNPHTAMPGMATFQNRDDATEFYEEKIDARGMK